jgi:hypothetical protein
MQQRPGARPQVAPREALSNRPVLFSFKALQFSKISKTDTAKSKGGFHGYGHGQMPANRARDSNRHQDRSRELSAQAGIL